MRRQTQEIHLWVGLETTVYHPERSRGVGGGVGSLGSSTWDVVPVIQRRIRSS